MARLVERQTGRVIAAELEAAVAPILERHGMDKGKVRWTFGDVFAFKIETVPVGADKPEQSDWKRFAALYSLPEDALGKQVRLGGRLFTIVGLNTRAPKNPVMLQDAAGKNFKAQAESVVRGLVLA